MSLHGLRLSLAVACLLGSAAGCRSMLEVPGSARASGWTDEDAPDGWLFDRLTGQTAPAPDARSPVTQASHVQLTPEEGLAASGQGAPISASSVASCRAAWMPARRW